MPVTARLSQKFYERLGEEVANELVDWFNAVDATYRNDLRELNELNFQRFDARQGERLAELRAELLRWMFGFWIATLVPLAGLMVGLFTLCAVVAVILLTINLRQIGFFEPTYELHFFFKDASGLIIGAPVTVHGVQAGTVRVSGEDRSYRARPLPDVMMAILRAGGLVEYLKRHGGYDV